MYRIVYFNFNPCDSIEGLDYPLMIPRSFATIEEAKEYIKNQFIKIIKKESIIAIGKDEADKLIFKYSENKTNETRISLKVIGEIVGRKEIFDCYRISIVETNEK